jgi:hypothetical protein
MSSDKIKSTIILEVLGRPPEHLEETLKDLIEKINKEKGVKVLNKKINKSVELEKKKGFYTSFAEIELETENLMYLNSIIFKYSPAYVEVTEPENITMKNEELGEVLSEIVRRLHKYDEVARILQNEKNILENKLKKLEENKKN